MPGTIVYLSNFDANDDSDRLMRATKGMGCNGNEVMEVLCQRNAMQRQQVVHMYQRMFEKDLKEHLTSKLSGDSEALVTALLQPAALYDALELQRALEKGFTDENALIEILSSRTNAQLTMIKDNYFGLTTRKLEDDIGKETSFNFKKLLLTLVAACRNETHRTDPERAKTDAQRLIDAGVGKIGTDESTFNSILTGRNHTQLKLVFEEYEKLAGHDIATAIKDEFSGNIRDGLLALCDTPAFFAKHFYDSMKGLGTNDRQLIRLVVTRAEIDMDEIKQQFEKLYKQTLETFIEDDTGGAYRHGLILLVKGNKLIDSGSL